MQKLVSTNMFTLQEVESRLNSNDSLFVTYSLFKHGNRRSTEEIVKIMSASMRDSFVINQHTCLVTLTSESFPRGSFWLVKMLADLFGCSFACADRDLSQTVNNYGAMTLEQRNRTFRDSSLSWSIRPPDKCNIILVDDISITGTSLKALSDHCLDSDYDIIGQTTFIEVADGASYPQIEHRINSVASFGFASILELVLSDDWLPNVAAIKLLSSDYHSSDEQNKIITNLTDMQTIALTGIIDRFKCKLSDEQMDATNKMQSLLHN